MKPGDLVSVSWTDAWFEVDGSDSWPTEYTVSTIGFLVEDADAWIRVAGEKVPDGWRAVSHIPRALILDVCQLIVAGSPFYSVEVPA